MNPRIYVTFDSDFPDDSEESPTGDVIKPRGHNVAVLLREILGMQGIKVSDVEQLEDYGWEFTVEHKSAKILLIIAEYQGPPSLELGIWDITPLFRRFFGAKSAPKHRFIMECLNESLRQDKRFRNIRWFTEDEFLHCRGAFKRNGRP
jgi:hypothetical protein